MNPSNPPPRRSALAGFARWATVLALVLVALFASYYVYFNVLNLAPASVYIVHRGTAVSAVYGTVTISGTYAVSLLAQNSGFVHLETLATPITLNGQIVKAGQLLCTVVDEAGKRQLEQAQRDYDATLSHQKSGPTVATGLQAAKDQLAAYRKLPPNTVPKVVFDAAVGEVTRLQNAFDSEVLELQHTVEAASNALQTLQEQAKRTRVESPIDGIITFVGYGENSYVLPNQQLFTISTTDMYVSGSVNEEDVGALKEGMKAELHLYAYPATTFDATVGQVLPNPDPNSSRYLVSLTMDAPPDNLRFGLTGEMNIILGRKPDTIVIPSRALNIDQVFIVEGGVVEQRTVKVGFKSLELAEILDGISEGNQVIVENQDAFRPGDRVRPVPVNPAKPPRK